MRTKAAAWLSTILIVFGLLIPSAAMAANGDPLAAASEALSFVTGDATADQPLILSQKIDNQRSAAGLAVLSTDNTAPGDSGETDTAYQFQYTGNTVTDGPATLTTTLAGDLVTCAPGKFSVSITDNQTPPKTYAGDKAGQEIGQLKPGATLIFQPAFHFDLDAGNECQGKTASLTMQVIATPSTPPPPPPAPPVTIDGRIQVHVGGTIQANPNARPPQPEDEFFDMTGATVTLTPVDLEKLTETGGRTQFTNLRLGTYKLNVKAAQPAVRPGLVLEGAAEQEVTVTLTQERPDVTVNVDFAYQLPNAPPNVVIERKPATIKVIVLDGSDRNPNDNVTPEPKPISNAAVTLTAIAVKDGAGSPVALNVVSQADANGTKVFKDLSFGSYKITAEARDPSDPNYGLLQSGFAETTVSGEAPDRTVTITLYWDVKPLAPPTPIPPVTGTPNPPVTVTVTPTPGTIEGRICVPKAPGAEVSVTGPDGKTQVTTFKPEGRLGYWKEYRFADLTPGAWTVSFKNHLGQVLTQQLTVPNTAPKTTGAIVKAGDFELACTGDGLAPVAKASQPWWPYLLGLLLLGAGLVLRWRFRGVEA